MAREISIAISAKDNFTQAINTMKNANSAFAKNIDETSEKLDALNRTKLTLKVDTDRARSDLKEAEKQFLATGDAADKMKMEVAGQNYDNAKRNLDLVSKNARQAQKDIESMSEEESKVENRAGGSGSAVSRMASALSGTTSALAKAGIGKMLGDSLSSAANAFVGSAFSNETGTAVSSVLGGAASGAAIGSIVPGIGTAIGAGVGAVAGGINAATKVFEDRDSAFKEDVQNTYNDLQQNESDMLSSGSAIAAAREQAQISFATLLGGSENAGELLDQIRDFAQKTPFEYDQLTMISRTLLAYGYKQDEIIPLLTKVGDAGSALGMTPEDVNEVATNIGRMQVTGKVAEQYLEPLLNKGIPVWDYLSKASGKTKEQVKDMVTNGLIPGEQAAAAIADYLGKDFSGNMEKQSKTYQGLSSNLEDVQSELENAMGQGYNEESKKGMQNEINTLSGSVGKNLKEAYEMQGKFKADLENSQKQLLMDAYTSVTTGKVTGKFQTSEQKNALQSVANDYRKQIQSAAKGDQTAEEAAARDIEKAKVIAANEYKASEGYQLEVESDLGLAASIRDDKALQNEYWDTGYQMGEEFSKGLAAGAHENNLKAMKPSEIFTQQNSSTPAGILGSLLDPSGIFTKNPSADKAAEAKEKLLDTLQKGPAGGAIHIPTMAESEAELKEFIANRKGKATGIYRVPYNGYPAILHEDEMVLTGAQGRAARQAAGKKIEININGTVVREEADIDKIARRIAGELKKAEAISD